MFTAPFSFLVPPAGGFDSDAQAYINAVLTAGGTLSTPDKNAINTYYLGLKSANIYSKMIAFYPIAGGVQNAHAINGNLNSTYNLVYSGGWTHTSTGQQPNGTTGYANTNFAIPVSGPGSVNNLTFGIYINNFNGISGSYDLDMGCRIPDPDNTHIWWLAAEWGATSSSRWSQEQASGDFVSPPSTGMYGASRTANNSIRVYKNGVLDTSVAQGVYPNLGSNGSFMFLGAISVGNVAQFFSKKTQCFSFIAEGLTNAENLTLYSLINDLQTAFGRNTY